MSKTLVLAAFAALLLSACGGGDKTPPANTNTTTTTTTSHTNPTPEPTPVTSNEISKDEKIAKGKEVYTRICQACHQADGKGLPGAFPPVAQSDYMEKDLKKSIHGVANGLTGEITVNGQKYNSAMPKPNPELTDEELASVFTYILNSFGNKGGEVTVKEAAEARK